MEELWQNRGGNLYREWPAQEQPTLENIVYVLGFNANLGQFYLKPKFKEFTFDYKLYDLEKGFINRFLRSFSALNGNLGALLNGTKGTGKTVTTKIIANQLNQPVIVVNKNFEKASPENFLNNIPQDITIFIDEYEKIYRDSNSMLTIMDGVLNADHRRVFLFTTNKLHIEDNLKQRPSRLRYLKSFGDLKPSTVEEIIDDCLIHTHHKNDCMSFITTLELITVDIVKQVIQEVNIHDEAPQVFEDDFNVRKQEGKYKIFEVKAEGGLELQSDNVNVYPRPSFNEQNEGYWFEMNGDTVGRIAEVLDQDTILVNLYEDEDNETVKEQICLRLERSFRVHSNYAYGYRDFDGGMGGSEGGGKFGYGSGNVNKPKVSDTFKERFKRKEVESEDEEVMEEKESGGSMDELAGLIAKKIQMSPGMVGAAAPLSGQKMAAQPDSMMDSSMVEESEAPIALQSSEGEVSESFEVSSEESNDSSAG